MTSTSEKITIRLINVVSIPGVTGGLYAYLSNGDVEYGISRNQLFGRLLRSWNREVAKQAHDAPAEKMTDAENRVLGEEHGRLKALSTQA